ncbi:hypothetical protein TEA_016968 [Camellia sinensis var. sinensis]|uniref:Glycosyltransferase n=1 Tax=Camellia sinensis var. sinensis TaxID=542762 RepID=A0A4S4DTV4_CAMSN|nr:hypothetical protein TEA_016968 [Camellia sinensis var. sinensis]
MPKRVEITRTQLPGSFVALPDLNDIRDQMREAESTAYGVVVNSFTELEHGCVEEYGKALDKKVWSIGPVSLCNKEVLDKFERGNKASIDEKECIQWLNSMKPNSVLYACLGSQCRLVPPQLIELGLGLESSKHPFIWVIKTGGERFQELEKWLIDENFEERVKGRGLVIKGWAPQLLILSHPSIKGFLTHCGWNSTIEAVCFGLPMATWPMFAEQFLNEKLVVEILRIGVRVGVEVPVRWGDEERVGVVVKREEVEKAIERVMEGGEEGDERRKRAIELGEKAKSAMENGGSAHLNISLLIEDIKKKVWSIGPVSLCNKEVLDKFERGNKASIDEKECIQWLNSMKPNSVLYACLGSQCRLVPPQLIELGLGLESSKHPFIWVIKTGGERFQELEKWLIDENFEERVKGRGLVIKGWAPQLLILSHPSIKGFLTHCGWNSTIEGVCFGLPMVTWPMFAEQFLNEKLVVEILRIGVRVGVEVPVRWGDEERVGVVVKREEVEKAIERVMEGGEEGDERRKRAIELGEKAKRAMENGGSAHVNISLLIEDIKKKVWT